ncbi:mannose-1-phosphate guanylyltransferase [Olivibacter sitiensis]|uniref:mannose-1-phosphate guanylyltransferase n=1 Tax=Olivibacter sitiensis TaxID=376470 RepID=UPI000428586E|nr:mannose-1-phosphate guanylyltransferase [Olivibacter sitiensis]
MNKNHYAIIMAGGVGSRFWPISRKTMPKQFIDVLGTGKTLIQDTYNRFLKIVPKENIYILTNTNYKDLVQEQLNMDDDSHIIGEPAMRNTAPCIAYASYKLRALNPNAVMVIAPSDHLIQDTDVFVQAIQSALNAAADNDALFTLGIKPSRPDTGYGYIHWDNEANLGEFKKVDAFVEKPDLPTAESYLKSGEYLWNAGIFIWKASQLIDELRIYSPNLNDILEKGKDSYNTPEEENFLLKNYPTCENISIDYAVMEKSKSVYVLPVDFGWSDLGTWTSVYGIASKDEWGNVVIPDPENIILYNSKNCMVNVPSFKRVVIKELEDYIIVESNNTLMICPKSSEQEVKQVVADVSSKFGESYI